MILALLMAWMWDRVLLNCQGGPEQMGYYYFSATTRVMQPYSCADDEGNPQTCYRVAPALPLSFGFWMPDPGVGTTVSTDVDPVATPSMLPLPSVGGFSAWPWPSSENPGPVVAVDAAGNESRACP